VSIVICNHDYARFLDAAIRSAVEQDHPDTEVIVVDDGSTDGSRDVIERWGNAIGAVYKPHGGQVSAYNAGFSLVTGDVVVFLDADDLLEHSACSRVVERFGADVVKVHFRLRLVDRTGSALGAVIPTHLSEGDLAEQLRTRGELYDSSPGSGNAYRVSTLRRLFPIAEDARDRHGADFFLVYGISLLGKVAISGPAPLARYRVHRRNAIDDIVFGNAVGEVHEPFRTYARHARLRAWVIERLGVEFTLAPVVTSFSLEKQGYAIAIFGAKTYLEGLRSAVPLLMRNVLPSLRLQRESRLRRAALAAWALGVLLLPRRAGVPLARFVCNPASRVGRVGGSQGNSASPHPASAAQ
jgi:glycosyltransferase involved in cell wall biosynthesis